MMPYAIAILSLAALCGAWIIFQQWIAKKMPGTPGIHRRCDGCDGREQCMHRGACEEQTDETVHLRQVEA